MKLIDANETLRLMGFEEYKYQYEEHYGYRQAEKFIELQPTVEAIPLEFIEEYISYQDTEEQKVLRMMWHAWELWEKENEIHYDTKAMDTEIHG